MMRAARLPSLLLLAALTASLPLPGCSSDGSGTGDADADVDADADTDADADADTDIDPPEPLPWLHATRGPDPGVFDDQGRQVLLRGVNFNHLADYWQVDGSLPTVAPLDDDDWDDAAAHGLNVVRLCTNWSAWEPERDVLDTEYLERVKAAVEAANRRGIYVVIDMHQDAWSKFVFTPREGTCPEDTHHQKGWDGAPEWATVTDDQPTCTPDRREGSPAVKAAWDNFYDNHDGIRDELAELWGQIAAEFADHPGVAGYDLLNEPGVGVDTAQTQNGLTDFFGDAVAEIRAAEAAVGGHVPGHIVFFEMTVFGGIVDSDFTDDTNIVFSPHNYGESIGPKDEGILDRLWGAYQLFASTYETSMWTGEYGSFSDEERNETWYARFAALEDAYPGAGSAWWYWEQECGDPHEVQYPPTEEWLADKQLECGDARFRVTTCARRPFPRAVPGRLRGLSAPGCLDELHVDGETDTPGTADLWFPVDADTEPVVGGAGVGEVTATRVAGGWRLDVEVSGTYRIDVTAGE